MDKTKQSRVFVKGIVEPVGELDPIKKHRKDICTEINKMIDEDYLSNVKLGLSSRSCWKFTGDCTETLGHISIGVSAIIAFAAGFFGIGFLSFIAGCFSTGAILLLKFSSYSMGESKERTTEINRILSKLNIDELVDIAIDSASDGTAISAPPPKPSPIIV